MLGTSRRNRLIAAFSGPGTGETVTRLSGHIDVHLVTHEQARGRGLRLPRLTRGLTTRRRLLGAAARRGAAAAC